MMASRETVVSNQNTFEHANSKQQARQPAAVAAASAYAMLAEPSSPALHSSRRSNLTTPFAAFGWRAAVIAS